MISSEPCGSVMSTDGCGCFFAGFRCRELGSADAVGFSAAATARRTCNIAGTSIRESCIDWHQATQYLNTSCIHDTLDTIHMQLACNKTLISMPHPEQPRGAQRQRSNYWARAKQRQPVGVCARGVLPVTI